MTAIDANSGPGKEHIYTPSELNREVRLHIEAGFPRILLEAEISNISRPASGHLYFSLKDESAQVRCALFRSAAARLGIRPENGMKVLARGRISLYEARGDFQMIVDDLQDVGEGLLLKRFEALKNKLQAEGLFDPAHKQAVASHPRRVALVTSASGAAVRDMLHVLQRRWPVARVRLYPASVQGAGAATEIVRALEAANSHGWAETLILGRGGGSLEDLMAFNEEVVARAVFASGIPVIAAVGHETDFSICDFVADLRAPTPSAAAELATPDLRRLRETFARAQRQLELRLSDHLNRGMQRIDHLAHRLNQRHPATQLSEQATRLNDLERAVWRGIENRIDAQQRLLERLVLRLRSQHPRVRLPELSNRVENARLSLNRLTDSLVKNRFQQLAELARTLHAVSPLSVIGRGYAVITAVESGEVVSSVSGTTCGATVSARLSDGRLFCRVEDIREEPP
jgi:exodeoxyribonuclease VII large subunit